MSWYFGPLVLVDTETTGVDVESDRIVTGTVVLIPALPPGGGPRVPKVFNWLADPGVEIPPGASDIHGITTEHARQRGRPPAEVTEEMASMIALLMGEGAVYIGMNCSFDLTILDRECLRHDVRSLDDRLAPQGTKPVVDVFVIDKEVRRGPGKRKLENLCAEYRVRLDGAHDATADALAAGRVAWAQCKRYPRVRDTKPEDLHDMQVKWKAKQSKLLAAWMRGRAAQLADLAERDELLAKADGVRPEWPLIPRAVPPGPPGPMQEELW